MSEPLLSVSRLTANYGAIQVLFGLSFDVHAGEVVVILGANGAGKTTTLRAVCSMVETGGSVKLNGEEVTGKDTAEIVRRGVAPLVIEDLFRRFDALNKETGTTMLIVEQNAELALEIASRGYVLEAGQIVLSGTAGELRSDDGVREAYLGA